MGKKESTDRRLNQACRLSVTPSSLSSLECRRSDARTATNGYVRTCSLNKSAKVVLGSAAKPQRPCDLSLSAEGHRSRSAAHKWLIRARLQTFMTLTHPATPSP